MAKWIKRLVTDQKILGSNPGLGCFDILNCHQGKKKFTLADKTIYWESRGFSQNMQGLKLSCITSYLMCIRSLTCW